MLLLGTVGVVLGSNADLRKSLIQAFSGAEAQIIYKPVRKQTLVITVTERGTLESGSNQDVFSQVEGQTTILWILPEGSQVKKGEKVVELDSATMNDNLTNQVIATRRAEADFEQARKTFEVAEIAVKEYMLGTYEQEKQTIQGEQKLAESELQRAIDRLEWSEAMLKKNYISPSQVLADQLAKLKAEISKAQAEKKMEVLKQFTYQKQLTELQANVEKARSDMMAKEQTYDLEKSKEEKLKRQIDNCVLFAPGDGLIVYANDPNRNRGSTQPQIEEGAVVRERQKIFSLPDIANMQVNTKVHESMVDRVEKGQTTQIRVDAFANVKLTGEVKKIQPLPDPSSFFSSDIKVYTTLVTIDQTFTALRPGMSAEVTVLIDTLKDVLCIPVTAVLPLEGKDFVYVKTPQGPKRQEVKLGKTNDILIEVK
ncbi:MAG TPA: efflux RND transporter periplasmic adaptor subunit, partial [Isosphaeraceae bacterium]|nr:efflux RND transporter periplasmic adaptor subunit [Isosphaeraceae bacterium]